MFLHRSSFNYTTEHSVANIPRSISVLAKVAAFITGAFILLSSIDTNQPFDLYYWFATTLYTSFLLGVLLVVGLYGALAYGITFLTKTACSAVGEYREEYPEHDENH
jgi:hypothetical protein